MIEKLKQIEELQDKNIKRSNFVNEILWSCAGVNKDIIRQCPNEYAKYAGAGGTILFTAIMAMISGGYAMYFVFQSYIVSFLFSVFWGILIFNLDRFIVNSMYVDSSPYLNFNKLKSAAPRFIMAIFLGIVISTPLEMKIFGDKIESQLIIDNIERKNDAKLRITDQTEQKELEEQQCKLLSQREDLTKKLQDAQRDLKEEGEGNALSGRAGHGPIYEDKEKYMLQCQENLDNWDRLNQQNLTNIQNRLNILSANINNMEYDVNSTYDDGFIARFESYSNLKENNTTLSIISYMITMLFIIIEIIPTFFKLIMKPGIYEQLCETYDSIHLKIATTKKDEIYKMLSKLKNNNEDILMQKEQMYKDQLIQQQNMYILQKTRDEIDKKKEELDIRMMQVNEKEQENIRLKQYIEEKDREITKLENSNKILARQAGGKSKKKKLKRRR